MTNKTIKANSGTLKLGGTLELENVPTLSGGGSIVDTVSAQSIAGAKTFSDSITLTKDSALPELNWVRTGTGAQSYQYRVDSAGSFQLSNETTATVPLIVKSTATTASVVLDGGNVGIGTASPAVISGGTALEISDPVGGELILTRADTGVIAGDLIGALAFKGTDASNSPPHVVGIKAFAVNEFGANEMRFYTVGEQYETNGTPSLVINAAGAVTLGPSGSTSTSLRHVFNIPDAASLVYTTTPQVQISSASGSGNGFPIIGMFNSGTETTSYNIFGSYIDDSTTPLYALRFEVRQNDNTAFSSRPSTDVAWAWTDVGIERMLLTHAGALSTSTGSLGTISDAALKNTIENLDKGLAEVLALQPRKWQWNKPENHAESPTYGFVAQEAETIIPEMVTKVGKFKNVQCGTATTAILVKAIQELHAELQAAKAEIEALKGN